MQHGSMHGNHIAIGGRGGQFFHIDWQLAGQSIANNTSTINWQAKFHYNLADAQLDNGTASLSGNRWSNGGRVRNYGGSFTTRSVTLASGRFTIGHNSNGTRSLAVSGGVTAWQSGRSSGSQSFNLPTIPRNSQVTTNDSGNWHLDTPLTIRTNRRSASFTHTITIRAGGATGPVLRTINSVGASVVWTPTNAEINTMQNAIPTANRIRVHITQRNNQVGQNSTVGVWGYIRNANPTFANFTYQDSNAATVAITGNNQVLVKGKSTLAVTVSAANRMTAIKGANATRYSFAYDGVSNNVNFSTSAVSSSFSNINTVGSRAILVTAYDSRSNNTRVAKNVQVYDYTAPNIEIEVSRQNNFGDNVTIETGGTFDLLPISGVNKNALTANSLRYRRREKGASAWSAWTAIPFTVDGDSFSGADQFITLDNSKEFEFEFEIADKFGAVTQGAELGRGTPLMFVGKQFNGDAAVGIGKMPENGVLDVEGDIYSNGQKLGPGAGYHVGVIPISTLSTTGHKTITGVGFKPKLVMFMPLGTSATNNNFFSIGFMTSETTVSSVVSSGAGSTEYSKNSSTTSMMVRIPGNSATPTLAFSYVSLNSNGFTINVTSASSAQVSAVSYIAFG